MKKFRKVLIAMLCVMLLVCVGLFEACDNGSGDNGDNGTPDNSDTNNGTTDNGGTGGGNTGDNTGDNGDEGNTGDEGGSGGTTDTTTYNVTVTCGEGGTYALSSAGPYHKGDEVTLTLLPYSGYAVQSVTVNGESVTPAENSCTLTVNAETSIQIVFHQLTAYTVDVTCGEGGSYSLSPDKSDYYAGDEVTLTVTHRRSYEFGDVTLNGNPVTLSEDGTYTFTVEDNVVIDITFEEIVTHTVSVTCGSGGTYSLSAVGPYADGQEVTLTVYPNAGMKAKTVTVNGEEVTLVNNAYTFHVTEDTEITISFRQKEEGEDDTYNIYVTCGGQGSYTLSPEGPYLKGTEVTLTVTPEEGYYVSSFTVDGKETTLKNGKYAFTVTRDIVAQVKFGESLFAAELTGVWNPLTESGTLGFALTLKGKSVVFSETGDAAKEYTLSVLGNDRYSFTVIDQEGARTAFTLSFLQAMNGKLLVLTHTESGETAETYYLLDGIDYYTVAFPNLLVGSWAPASGGAGTPIEITETGIYYGGLPAIVLSYNAETYEIVLLEGTIAYTQATDSVTFTPSDADSDAVSYHREISSGPVLVPAREGTYSNSEHTVVIDAEGHFNFDGTVRTLTYDEETKAYTFRVSSKEYTVVFTSSSVKVFSTSSNADWTLRKIEEGMVQYTLTVTYAEEQGSIKLSPLGVDMKYWEGETVTLTVTPNTAAHYEVDKITINGEEKTLSTAGTVKFTMNADTTLVVTFKEFTEKSLLSEENFGEYTGGAVTLTISESGVTVVLKNMTTDVTFTEDMITQTGSNTYTLKNMSRVYTITVNDDGSLTLGDVNWSINGGNHKLTKKST